MAPHAVMNRLPSLRRIAWITACLVGPGLIVVGIVRLSAADIDWRDLHQFLGRCLGFVFMLGIVGYIFFVRRWLVRAGEAWLPSIATTPPPEPVGMRDKLRTWALYSLGGGLFGATLGVLFFVIVRRFWALTTITSNSTRAGGDPIDDWAHGIVMMIAFAIVTLPFALAGLQVGYRAANRRLNRQVDANKPTDDEPPPFAE